MEILIGVLVGIDVVFIGLFYVMWRRLRTMKNRIKMIDIRLGKEHEVSLELTRSLNTAFKLITELNVEISKLKGEIYES